MSDFWALAMKGLAVTGALIAVYFIFKNPQSDATLLSGGTNAYVSGVKALQGR